MKSLHKLLIVLALATVAPAPAIAADNDVKGPRCADVVDGGAAYTSTHTLRVAVGLAAAPCRAIAYTLTVFDEPGDTTAIATATGTPSEMVANRVEFTVAVPDEAGDDTVCTLVTTSAGRHTFDLAPDEGCIDVTVDTPPARPYN